jgi:hypothetical protein
MLMVRKKYDELATINGMKHEPVIQVVNRKRYYTNKEPMFLEKDASTTWALHCELKQLVNNHARR